MTSLPAPPHAPVNSPVDPVDPGAVVTDASARFATHLELLAHQLGEHSLDDAERERLAAALAGVQWTVAKVGELIMTSPPQTSSA
ncbi:MULTISPECIES: hypothetical protein [unclassified Nonomuraea]|uniref:hypothetical protein n=1 Tax=Nonomuraea sp. NPDC047529 TaxID=3155623 RepID=UPI0033EE590E